LPILQSIKIPQRDIKSETESIKMWYEFQSRLASVSPDQTPANEEMKVRRQEAKKILPLRENVQQLSEIAALI
jgi:hypothetical protein